MKRRELITLLGGVAAWPLSALQSNIAGRAVGTRSFPHSPPTR
jgi:hypothetical protein